MGFRASTRVRLSGVAFLVALVAGCGGGGGSAAPAPVPPPVAPPPPASQLLDWDVHPAASAVLGQAAFDSVAPGDLSFPQGNPAVMSSALLLVAAGGELKGFENYTAGGAIPRLTFAVNDAVDVFARGNKLVVVDDDRVRIYNDLLATGDLDPDVVSSGIIGCGRNAMNHARGAYLAPTGHLIVADSDNHRVLIWTPERVPASGELPEPSVVVGQPDKETCDPNAGGGTESLSEFTLNQPRSVWSDGARLVVADEGNHRVLIWDQIPTEDFQPATYVVGQPNFDVSSPNRGGPPSEFTLSSPASVDVSEAGQMAVTDSGNHRVLVWNAVPRADSVPADHVLGQGNFVRNLENDSDQVGASDVPSAKTLNDPRGARFHKRNLIVVDSANNRVLVFPAAN
jgi:NHL repeat